MRGSQLNFNGYNLFCNDSIIYALASINDIRHHSQIIFWIEEIAVSYVGIGLVALVLRDLMGRSRVSYPD